MNDKTLDDTTQANEEPWLNDPMASAYPESTPFWEAASQDKLVLKHCNSCGKAHWYPRAICPLCGSTDLDWVEASGRGTLYAFSPARRATPQYTLAYVTLDEGPTLMTNIVGSEPEDLEVGMAVSVTFQAAEEGRMMPFFKPL